MRSIRWLILALLLIHLPARRMSCSCRADERKGSEQRLRSERSAWREARTACNTVSLLLSGHVSNRRNSFECNWAKRFNSLNYPPIKGHEINSLGGVRSSSFFFAADNRVIICICFVSAPARAANSPPPFQTSWSNESLNASIAALPTAPHTQRSSKNLHSYRFRLLCVFF